MTDATPTCGSCGRQRTLADSYDYNPLQVVTGQPLGWYSGDDGELCSHCVTELLGGKRRPAVTSGDLPKDQEWYPHECAFCTRPAALACQDPECRERRLGEDTDE